MERCESRQPRLARPLPPRRFFFLPTANPNGLNPAAARSRLAERKHELLLLAILPAPFCPISAHPRVFLDEDKTNSTESCRRHNGNSHPQIQKNNFPPARPRPAQFFPPPKRPPKKKFPTHRRISKANRRTNPHPPIRCFPDHSISAGNSARPPTPFPPVKKSSFRSRPPTPSNRLSAAQKPFGHLALGGSCSRWCWATAF